MTVVAETENEPSTPAPPVDHHGHPDDAQYWMIGGILALLTLVEVSTYWWPEEWHKFTWVALMTMMAVKFVLVAYYFMHLKFDLSILRRIFFFGLALAIVVYLVMLSTFVFWDDSGNLDETFPDAPRDVQAPPTVPAS